MAPLLPTSSNRCQAISMVDRRVPPTPFYHNPHVNGHRHFGPYPSQRGRLPPKTSKWHSVAAVHGSNGFGTQLSRLARQ